MKVFSRFWKGISKDACLSSKQWPFKMNDLFDILQMAIKLFTDCLLLILNHRMCY